VSEVKPLTYASASQNQAIRRTFVFRLYSTFVIAFITALFLFLLIYLRIVKFVNEHKEITSIRNPYLPSS